jgi:hypothetical protein
MDRLRPVALDFGLSEAGDVQFGHMNPVPTATFGSVHKLISARDQGMACYAWKVGQKARADYSKACRSIDPDMIMHDTGFY